MDDLIKVKMWHAEYENLRINFHINSIPWRYKHIHDYWEIQIMLSGEARNIINGRELSISKGEMQILRPDDTHVFTSFDNKEYACLNIEIKKDNFVSIVQSFYPSLMNRLLSEESHVPICFLTQNILLNIQNHIYRKPNTHSIPKYHPLVMLK